MLVALAFLGMAVEALRDPSVSNGASTSRGRHESLRNFLWAFVLKVVRMVF